MRAAPAVRSCGCAEPLLAREERLRGARRRLDPSDCRAPRRAAHDHLIRAAESPAQRPPLRLGLYALWGGLDNSHPDSCREGRSTPLVSGSCSPVPTTSTAWSEAWSTGTRTSPTSTGATS